MPAQESSTPLSESPWIHNRTEALTALKDAIVYVQASHPFEWRIRDAAIRILWRAHAEIVSDWKGVRS